MLEVQALRFARMFSRQVALVITPAQAQEFQENLQAGKKKALAELDSKALEAFLEADHQFLKAQAEGRLKIRS